MKNKSICILMASENLTNFQRFMLIYIQGYYLGGRLCTYSAGIPKFPGKKLKKGLIATPSKCAIRLQI